jgi:DNA polymerase-3 subunit delta'
MNFNDFAERYPEITDCLKQARREKRLAHAYLLHGDTPEIRSDFAKALAQMAICPTSLPDGAPCGKCPICDQLSRDVYPEYHTLSPVGKAWRIQVGDRTNPEPNTVRWFEELFYLTSTSGADRKVGVIFDADRMNTESQNAFLKTLEEPPRDSFFILATGNPSALLPTTRSRCQSITLLENRCRFDFPGAPELFAALYKLQFESSGDLPGAEQAAAAIIALSRQLEDMADNKTENEWAERLAQAEEMDPAMRKRMEKQAASGAAGEYMRVRKYFLGAIHTWFAQVYQLASGASMKHLANPEIFEGFTLPEMADEKALAALQEADSLLYNMYFNINEELALRSFCMNVALKR